ncbi:MAG: sprT domain-containing protein [Eudoraea sp.]|nr:sprT domain-containing protein [Eudoraea sp.]
MASQIVTDFIPSAAIDYCQSLLNDSQVKVKITAQRVTRHGDYKQLPDGTHRISLNASQNPYRFLITFIHELAHLQAFEGYGRRIKPHGKEWKQTFTFLMAPLLRPEVFPNELLSILARHFRNPKASSSTDSSLAMALKAYDPPSDKSLVGELSEGSAFRLYNGKSFKRGKKRVKRIECHEIGSGRVYLFQPHAEVDPI